MHRLQMLGMVALSYAVDTLLLLALAATGVIEPLVAWAYACAGLALCTFSFVLLQSRWCENQGEHCLVLPQLVANVAITVAFMAWVPQIGGLLLMLLFVIYAFGALRMSLRPVLASALLISALVGALVANVGDPISLPMASLPERALSGLWFALVLLRCALLGLYGSELRALLVKRKAQLDDSFEKLEQLAHRDELTGALNRRSVLRLLDEERERMQRSGQHFGVAVLDIDHFKQIDELHGPLVGDDVLRRFALKVAAELRNTDRLGRQGREEFLLLLTSVADINAAAEVATRVRMAVAGHSWGAALPGQVVTVSAGVAMSRAGESIEKLLARTDLALQQAIHDGRNCVRSA